MNGKEETGPKEKLSLWTEIVIATTAKEESSI